MGNYRKVSDAARRLKRFCDDHKIEHTFSRRGAHPCIVVEHKGRTVVVSFPLTTCNFRAPKLAVSKLRHRLGLVNRGAQ